MYTIHLDKLQFFAYHGIHPEEKILGSAFEVSLSINVTERPVSVIGDTVDYVKVYELLQHVMSKPEELLEVLTENICSEIKSHFSSVSEISISIYKTRPPIQTFTGRVGVSLIKKYTI